MNGGEMYTPTKYFLFGVSSFEMNKFSDIANNNTHTQDTTTMAATGTFIRAINLILFSLPSEKNLI